jgi:hypothetical protein
MSQFLPSLTPELTRFIQRQHMFFTGTAAAEGRINVSPKGIDTFRVIDEKTVGYLDLTGSGNETAAHILASRRITIMFCAFDGAANILRLYGRGEVVRPDHVDWAKWESHFPTLPGQRQIILLHIDNLQTSCGWGVPKMKYVEERTKLLDWASEKGPAGVNDYQQKKNKQSIDGLPTSIR